MHTREPRLFDIYGCYEISVGGEAALDARELLLAGHLGLVFCGGTATSNPPRHVSLYCN